MTSRPPPPRDLRTTHEQSQKLVHLIVNTHTHTHPFNGLFSGTTRVSQYQKGKTNVDFTGARDSEWQWHQLGRMQVCTSLQTDNHSNTPPLSFLQAGCPSCRPTNSVKALKARSASTLPLNSYQLSVSFLFTLPMLHGVWCTVYARNGRFGCPSIRPFVCPVDRHQPSAAAWARAADIDR